MIRWLKVLLGIEDVADEPVVTITLREYRCMNALLDAKTALIENQERRVADRDAEIERLRALIRKGL